MLMKAPITVQQGSDHSMSRTLRLPLTTAVSMTTTLNVLARAWSEE